MLSERYRTQVVLIRAARTRGRLMRRACLALGVWLSLGAAAWVAAAAWGRPVDFAGMTAARSVHDKRTGKHAPRNRCPAWAASPTHPVATAGGWLLLGQRRIEPTMGQSPPGVAQAFSFKAGMTGEVSSIHVYVDSRDRARRLMAGIYSSSGCRPGSRLTSGSLMMRLTRAHRGRTPRHRRAHAGGGWRVVSVHGATIVSGRDVLARGGGQRRHVPLPGSKLEALREPGREGQI